MAVDQLSNTFAALADPTRRAILGRLAEGEATVNELAEPFDMSLQAISKHLKVLERAGLISRGRRAQFRPCRLEPARLDTAADWIAENRRMWDERYDRMDRHLATLRGRATRSSLGTDTDTDTDPGLDRGTDTGPDRAPDTDTEEQA